MATRSKALVCGRSPAEIVGSNPTGGAGPWMLVCCECCVLSGRGLCDELITRPEESYRLRCVVVCDLETSGMRRPWPYEGCCARNRQTYVKAKQSYRCAKLRTELWTCMEEWRHKSTHFIVDIKHSRCEVRSPTALSRHKNIFHYSHRAVFVYYTLTYQQNCI